MSEMVERAAKAYTLSDDMGAWTALDEVYRDEIREGVRAALLAALDLSEDKRTFDLLVTALAIADDGHPSGLKYRELAKAALSVLREAASQGGSAESRDLASERQLPRDPLADDPANGDERAPGDSVKRGFD